MRKISASRRRRLRDLAVIAALLACAMLIFTALITWLQSPTLPTGPWGAPKGKMVWSGATAGV